MSMKFSELPIDVQTQLRKNKEQYVSKRINDSYTVHMYSTDGTRYIYARRHAIASQYMSFGGGSYWTITYGVVQFEGYRNPVGERDYRWCDGSKTFGKSANGTVIPHRVDTKNEVLEIIKSIGIFGL